MIFAVLLVMLIGIPLLEIYVVIEVGRAIGVFPTLALLLADALLGAMMMRSQSRAVWRAANQTIRSGRVPTAELFDGTLVLIGGAFLIAPGFITDIFGALLLIPISRRPIKRLISARLARRLSWSTSSATFSSTSRADRPKCGYDVESEASSIDDPALDR